MVRENILEIKERIASACSMGSRDPAEVIIIAVSKGRAIEQIREAVAAGITDIGENRVQEALLKYNDMRYAISDKPYRWHLVGHLQTNKVRDAVGIFDLIQSVESLHLAHEIDKQAARINKMQEILVEIKTSPEDTRFGLKPDEAIGVIKEIAKLQNLRIQGLMTIAPYVKDPEETRSYFRQLKELRDKINELNEQNGLNGLNVLSMGMSDDFEVAIEEGANMVRLGRAIFE